MFRIHLFIIAVFAATVFCSCDEGRLYDDNAASAEEGRTAMLHATVKGSETWPLNYTLAIAGFAAGNDYALISKSITIEVDGVCDIELTGIPAEATTVELCIIDRLRRRIATFISADCGSSAGTILLAGDAIDVSMSQTIQRDIFNTTCSQCHGAIGFAAGGLNLTEGKSFGSLVSVSSVKIPGLNRVEPGNSAASVLYRVLSSGESSSWSYNHSAEVPRQEKLELIKNWIDGGARH